MPKPAIMVNACGRALRRSIPALATTAALVVLGGTAYAGYRFVTTSPRFAITAITVQGNHRVSADQIRAATGLALGDNVFAAQLDHAATGVRSNPWVADVDIHRVLPHTIAVEVHEREAAAVVELGGLYLVDNDGHPFKRLDEADGAGLPVITGIDRATPEDAVASLVHSALQARALWSAVAGRPAIGEIHLGAHGGLTVETYDAAIAIDLGALDVALAARMDTFDAAWAQLTDSQRARARAIHVAPRLDQVTVALKEP